MIYFSKFHPKEAFGKILDMLTPIFSRFSRHEKSLSLHCYEFSTTCYTFSPGKNTRSFHTEKTIQGPGSLEKTSSGGTSM